MHPRFNFISTLSTKTQHHHPHLDERLYTGICNIGTRTYTNLHWTPHDTLGLPTFFLYT